MSGKYNPNKLPHGEASFNALYSVYKYAAERRKLPFELTKDEFKALTQQLCFYCGTEPCHTFVASSKSKGKLYTNGGFTYNGIDRVDNQQGYTVKNSVTCCEVCNRAKRTMSAKQFAEWIKRVFVNWAGKN